MMGVQENSYQNGPPDFIIRKKNRTQYNGAVAPGMSNTYYKKRGYNNGNVLSSTEIFLLSPIVTHITNVSQAIS